MTTTAKTPNHENDQPVDDYTAKMDRMLDSLKTRSQDNRKVMNKRILAWMGVGAVASALMFYLLFNVTSEGFTDTFTNLVK